jgi:hypothetical protein
MIKKESLSLEKLKADILLKSSLEDIEKNPELQHIRAEMERMPVNKMINAVNYMDSNILPAIEKRGGKESADYKFFAQVCDLLLWAIVLHDRFKLLERKWTDQKIDLIILRERMTLYEQELNKYATVEDLWLTEGLDHIAKGIKARAEAILNRKK